MMEVNELETVYHTRLGLLPFHVRNKKTNKESRFKHFMVKENSKYTKTIACKLCYIYNRGTH